MQNQDYYYKQYKKYKQKYKNLVGGSNEVDQSLPLKVWRQNNMFKKHCGKWDETTWDKLPSIPYNFKQGNDEYLLIKTTSKISPYTKYYLYRNDNSNPVIKHITADEVNHTKWFKTFIYFDKPGISYTKNPNKSDGRAYVCGDWADK